MVEGIVEPLAIPLLAVARRPSPARLLFLRRRNFSSSNRSAMPPTQSPPALADEQMQRLMVSEDALPSLAQQLPPVANNCTRLYLCRHGQTGASIRPGAPLRAITV